MKGDIHFHDADYSPFTSMNNCSLPDFGDMLKHGFALGNAMMDSPKSIGTASTQITQIIKDIAGAQYGGQTVNRADEMLEEYAKRDYVKNLDMAHAMIPRRSRSPATWWPDSRRRSRAGCISRTASRCRPTRPSTRTPRNSSRFVRSMRRS